MKGTEPFLKAKLGLGLSDWLDYAIHYLTVMAVIAAVMLVT